MVLTEPGRRTAREVSQAFDRLDAAFTGLRAEDDGVLTLSTTDAFASTWLAWRLGGFQMRHPAMAVRMLTGSALVDFAADAVDVAIRSGPDTGWPGLRADRLIDVRFTPMCSPAFLAAHGGALTPADVLDLPRISPQDAWWAHWLREAGVAVPDGPVRGGVRLDSQALEGSAAMAGQGVAMLTPFLWRKDLAEGRLVRPFEQVSTQGSGYWLVCPEHRRRVPKIQRFREWLLAEITRDLGEEPRG